MAATESRFESNGLRSLEFTRLKAYNGRLEKFTEEEMKARIVECWNQVDLLEIRKCISS